MNGSLRSETRIAESQPAGLAAIPSQSGTHTHCRTCLAPAPQALYRVVGAWSVINGVALWDCETCARERILEIEAGQDVRRSRR
ncbi:hypothetical protein GCM10022223_37720 [Kineosporia mesophila]|uniref:Uncharacterized protein n=1 Tax=Kineosporia mesophila TaxID=566012 RepID=A0ABP6ZR00_9ACTN|nr:hypothetical protein [Kineosporia mesophila]MCD5349805.1 hypothetical protein [Kineosporia mesophila]